MIRTRRTRERVVDVAGRMRKRIRELGSTITQRVRRPFQPRLLDTGSNRSSAINVASPWRGLLPFPDGTVGQADRQHASSMYAGILAESPVVSTLLPMTSMMMTGVGH